eukprot:3566360-Pyramimonas_sp.AAC.1
MVPRARASSAEHGLWPRNGCARAIALVLWPGAAMAAGMAAGGWYTGLWPGASRAVALRCCAGQLVGRRPNHPGRARVALANGRADTRLWSCVGSAKPMVRFPHRTTVYRRLPTTKADRREVCDFVTQASLQLRARASAY